MKTCRGVEVQPLGWADLPRGTHSKSDWVGLRARLNSTKKSKTSSSLGIEPPGVQQVARSYPHWTIPAAPPPKPLL
jgi:hypothetical protein